MPDNLRDESQSFDHISFETETEAQQAASERFAGALPLCCWAMIQPDFGGPAIPLLHFVPVDRPDIVDVPRAMESEGVGSGRPDLNWQFITSPEGGRGVLTFDLTRPIRCRFQVAVNLAEHHDLLEMVADRGALDLLVGNDCPEAETQPTTWGHFICRTQAIEDLLANSDDFD